MNKKEATKYCREKFSILEKYHQEQNVKDEKLFYAGINYFRLISLSKIHKYNYDMFCLMEGWQKIDQLIQDIQEERINLCDSSLGGLFLEMCFIADNTKPENESMFLQAKEEFAHILGIISMFIDEITNDLNADVALIKVLSSVVTEHYKVRDYLLSTEKQKTIGERK